MCALCSGCGCWFVLNLLTQPRPWILEEAWRESWGSWSEESFTPHRVRIQDDSLLWPPLCRLPLATCLNRPHRRLQRKGVNCKPFHANFETHFLHTHHSRSTKIIHGICSIFSYSAGTRPYSNQNTKRFQFGSVAFSVLLASCSGIQIPRRATCLFFSQDRRTEACNRIVQTQAGWQQQGVNWDGQQISLSMEFQATYRVTPEYCAAFLSSGSLVKDLDFKILGTVVFNSSSVKCLECWALCSQWLQWSLIWCSMSTQTLLSSLSRCHLILQSTSQCRSLFAQIIPLPPTLHTQRDPTLHRNNPPTCEFSQTPVICCVFSHFSGAGLFMKLTMHAFDWSVPRYLVLWLADGIRVNSSLSLWPNIVITTCHPTMIHPPLTTDDPLEKTNKSWFEMGVSRDYLESLYKSRSS